MELSMVLKMIDAPMISGISRLLGADGSNGVEANTCSGSPSAP